MLLLLFGFIFWVAIELQTPDGEEENGNQEVRSLAQKLWGSVKNVVSVIRDLYATVRRYAQIYFWLLCYRIHSRIARLATIIFLIAGFAELLEKLLELANQFIENPALRYLFEGNPHFNLFRGFVLFEGWVEQVLENLWILMPLLVVEAWVIIHHFREPGHHHHERTTLTVLNEMLAPLNQYNTALGRSEHATTEHLSEQDREALVLNYYKILSLSMDSLFRERHVANLNISIMRPTADGSLRVIYQNEPKQFDDLNVIFERREGAAGRAFASGNPFYIPSIKYRHAVELVLEKTHKKQNLLTQQPKKRAIVKVRRMKVRLNVYKQLNPQLLSVLSIPIRRELPAVNEGEIPKYEVVGVVNLSSTKKSAFHGSDFDIADLVSAVIGVLNL